MSALTDDQLDPRRLPLTWHFPTDLTGFLAILGRTPSFGQTDRERVGTLMSLPVWRVVPPGLASELEAAGLVESGWSARAAQTQELIADNPWQRLPEEGDLVLPGDEPAATGYALWKVPSPWSGPAFTADILILLLNPGLSEDADRADLEDPVFRRMMRLQLTGLEDLPWCQAQWEGTGAGRYWSPRLRDLIADSSRSAVAAKVAIVEWIAYSSRRWVAPRAILPSQAFTSRVLVEAIGRGAYIVLTRGRRLWISLVPELADARLITLRSPRYSGLSRGNLEAADYRSLIDLLGGAPRPLVSK